MKFRKKCSLEVDGRRCDSADDVIRINLRIPYHRTKWQRNARYACAECRQRLRHHFRYAP
jgi:ribosomal protein L31E